MSSFEAIYKINCQKRGEEPLGIALYQELDAVWNWIISHQFKNEMLACLKDDRLCIAVPAELSKAPKGFYDVIAEDSTKTKLYFFDILTDKYRVIILNKLYESEAPPEMLLYYGDKGTFVKWKLCRLEKRYKCGTWKKFAQSYK